MNHVTLLILEQFSESWSDNSSFAKLSKRELRDAKNTNIYETHQTQKY